MGGCPHTPAFCLQIKLGSLYQRKIRVLSARLPCGSGVERSIIGTPSTIARACLHSARRLVAISQDQDCLQSPTQLILMKLQIGQIAHFNDYTYEVRSQIGSGTVSDVYLATLEGAPAPAEVVIKLVQDRAGPDSRQAQGARTEADVLMVLNRAEDKQWTGLDGPVARFNRARQTVASRRIIALLDSGVDTNGRVFLIQEQAPPAFRPIPIENVDDERRIIGVAEAIARAIELAHANGYALKDFEPQGEKADRIRIDWDAPSNVKIIDWNITAGPNATVAEKASDLVYLGGHLYYFLVGKHIDPSDQVSIKLGMSEDSWTEKSSEDRPYIICEGSRSIVRRLLYRRYRDAREVREDLSWWMATLAQKSASDLDVRIRQAGDRPDRKLAAADLALRLALNPQERERFERLADQMRREIERAERVLLDQGILNLRTGLYRKAIEEFDRNLRDPQFPPELAREARLYRLQAQFAIWLREQTQGGNLSSNPVWQLVGRAVDDLRRQQWPSALGALDDAIDRLPAVGTSNPLHQLHGVARAGQLAGQTRELQNLARGGPTSIAALDRWIRDEQKRQVELTQVLDQLRHVAHELASAEPDVDASYRVARDFLKNRTYLLGQYEYVSQRLRTASDQRGRADALLAHASLDSQDEPADGDLIAAYSAVEEVLAEALDAATQVQEYATDSTSQLLLDIQAQFDEVRHIRQSLTQLPSILRQIQRGEYDQALADARQAAAYLPAYAPANAICMIAQTGVERQSKAQTYIDQAREAIRQRMFGDAQNLLDRALDLDAQPLIPQADHRILPTGVADLVFHLPNKDEVQPLAGVIQALEEVRQLTLGDRARDHTEVIRELESLRREIAPYGYGLSDDENARLRDARQGLQQIRLAEDSLTSARSHDRTNTRARAADLLATLAHLQNDPTARARELRDEAGQEWLLLCEQEQDFDLVYDLLSKHTDQVSGTSFAEKIQDLRNLAIQGARIAHYLPTDDSETPAWLYTKDRNRRLVELSSGLRALSDTSHRSSLRSLRGAVQHWHDRLISMLTAYLREVYDQACALSDRQEFDRALILAEAAWQSVPTELYDAIPDVSASLKQLIAELERRAGVENRLGRIIQQLVANTIGFPDALETLPTQLPSHPHIALTHIVGFIDGLTELARLVAAQPPAHETEAQRIYRLYTRNQEIARIRQRMMLFIPAQALEARLDQIGRDATQQAIKAADDLCARLVKLATLSTVDPGELAQLFWTAAWWQATSAERDPIASARAARAIEQARAARRSLAAQVRDSFLNTASLPDVETALQQIREQNDRLTNPSHAAALPNNVALPTPAPLFDADALADWQEIAAEFSRVGRADAPQQREASSSVQIAQAIETLQAFRRQLEKFRSVVCPTLFPEEYVDDSNLALLDREAERLIDLAQSVRQTQALQRQMRVPEALQILYQHASYEDGGEHTWLLKPLRATLLRIYRTLRGELEEAIKERASTLLDRDDLDRAAQSLRDQLLAMCASDDLARLVEDAILRCIARALNGPKQTERALQASQVSARWRIVRDATARWRKNSATELSGDRSKTGGDGGDARIAPSTALTPATDAGEFAIPEQVRDRWAFLHERATQELRKLEADERMRQTDYLAGWSSAFRSSLGVAALAMLLFLGGIGTGLLIAGYRQGNQAVSPTDTMEPTLAPTSSTTQPSPTAASGSGSVAPGPQAGRKPTNTRSSLAAPVGNLIAAPERPKLPEHEAAGLQPGWLANPPLTPTYVVIPSGQTAILVRSIHSQ